MPSSKDKLSTSENSINSTTNNIEILTTANNNIDEVAEINRESNILNINRTAPCSLDADNVTQTTTNVPVIADNQQTNDDENKEKKNEKNITWNRKQIIMNPNEADNNNNIHKSNDVKVFVSPDSFNEPALYNKDNDDDNNLEQSLLLHGKPVETYCSDSNQPITYSIASDAATNIENNRNNDNDGENSTSNWLSRQIKKAKLIDVIPHGGAVSSGVNLASATLGAGALALPSAMSEGGTLFSSLFLCLCCAGTVYSIRLLIITLELTGCSTYEDMALVLIGKKFRILTAALIVLFCWGITIVYVVAMGDILDPIRELDSFPVVFKGPWGRRLLITIFWAIFMLPLSLAKEINTLRYASMIGMMSIFYLTIAIVVHTAETSPAVPKPEPKLITLSTGTILALPLIIFSYCCQTNSFEIYAELKNKSVNKMTVISAVSMATCTTIYIIVGLAGVYNFGAETKGNILNNYDDVSRKPYLIVAFAAVSITLTMAFPICIFPTRDAVLQIIGYKGSYDTPMHIRVPVAGCLAVGSLVVGLFVPQITILFGLLGGICGSTLAFIWPGIFILKTGKWNAEHGVGFVSIAMTWALIIGGTIAGLMGTAVSIYEQF